MLTKKSFIYSITVIITLLFTQITHAYDDKAFVIYLQDGTTVQYRLADIDSVVYCDYVPEPTFLNDFEYIDLGVSVKWATCNVGASSPEQAGYYVTWGDTVGYTDYMVDGHQFSWSTYKYCEGTNKTLTKYCDNINYGYVTDSVTLSRFSDGLTSLLPEDDAATHYMGEGWRIPTHTEYIELIRKCYWEWTSDYKGTGVAGYIVYKAKDEDDMGAFSYARPELMNKYALNNVHIFMPAAGYRESIGGTNTATRNKAGVAYYGKFGNYWCSDMETNKPDAAYYHNFSSTTGGTLPLGTNVRFKGRCIRAVCSE